LSIVVRGIYKHPVAAYKTEKPRLLADFDRCRRFGPCRAAARAQDSIPDAWMPSRGKVSLSVGRTRPKVP